MNKNTPLRTKVIQGNHKKFCYKRFEESFSETISFEKEKKNYQITEKWQIHKKTTEMTLLVKLKSL